MKKLNSYVPYVPMWSILFGPHRNIENIVLGIECFEVIFSKKKHEIKKTVYLISHYPMTLPGLF